MDAGAIDRVTLKDMSPWGFAESMKSFEIQSGVDLGVQAKGQEATSGANIWVTSVY